METNKFIFTVDLEDWFHILGDNYEFSIERWSSLESRIERNTHYLLNIFSDYKIKVTFFVLGWVAENYPGLISLIEKNGHEIASHGYSHKLIYNLLTEDFRKDIKKSKIIIEDLIGKEILGFRAPGFSITDNNLWALDVLYEEGFQYDSSFFPTSHSHGGIKTKISSPQLISTPKQYSLYEVPVSSTKIFNRSIVYTGGGYLRLCPSKILKHLLYKQKHNNEIVLFYIHPREIDCDQPRLKLKWDKLFKYYYGLTSVKAKLEFILAKYEFVTISDFLQDLSSVNSKNHFLT